MFTDRPRWPKENCQRTPYDIVGPYYVPNAPYKTIYCNIDRINAPKLIVHGHILEEHCKKAIVNATLEIWQANSTGQYNEECRGHLRSDQTGYFRFETIHPGHYYLETFLRASHLHYRVSVPQSSFITQQYFRGDNHTYGQVEALLSQTRPVDPDQPYGDQIVEFNFIMQRLQGT